MNPNILTIVTQAAMQVAQILIEKWINTKRRRNKR